VNDVTRLLNAIDGGDLCAADELLPIVYKELRGLAAWRMAQEKPGQTLQPTALVHEAYLRLMQNEDRHWDGRNHFFAAAAEAMRRILVESARRKASQKRGGDFSRVDWTEMQLAVETESDQLLALNDALTRLEERDKTAAELVNLRFFAGFSSKEAADALGLPERTATRLWAYARAWLLKELRSLE